MVTDRHSTFADRVRMFIDGSEVGRAATNENRNPSQEKEIQGGKE